MLLAELGANGAGNRIEAYRLARQKGWLQTAARTGRVMLWGDRPRAQHAMKAIWNDTVIAESDATVVVEGNHYFPPGSIRREFLQPSATTSVCHWKGTAHYYSLEVNGERNPDAAWYYPDPKPEAAEIAGHVAFWRGVRVVAD